MSVEGKMRAVLDALADLEREWSHGPMPPARVSRVFHPEHVKECRDVFFFRLGVVDRLNALFAQKSLARRYGMSKRAVEDVCEFTTFHGVGFDKG